MSFLCQIWKLCVHFFLSLSLSLSLSTYLVQIIIRCILTELKIWSWPLSKKRSFLGFTKIDSLKICFSRDCYHYMTSIIALKHSRKIPKHHWNVPSCLQMSTTCFQNRHLNCKSIRVVAWELVTRFCGLPPMNRACLGKQNNLKLALADFKVQWYHYPSRTLH